jgi:hypothetical protein
MNLRRAALAVLVLLVLAGSIYVTAFRDPAPPGGAAVPAARPNKAAPVPPPAPPARGEFVLGDVEGVVEVRRAGTWNAVRAGETVGPGEAIRTSDGGRAVLRTAGGDELSLRPRVELAVTNLSDAVAELTLTRGKVRAAPAEGRERFQISAAQARAVGKGGGRFTVFADPRGAVTVASESGDVAVLAGGREVTVGAHQSTVVRAGQAPSDPAFVPDDVFLAVSWPEGEVRARKATVRGQVAPGSEVRVNGATAEVKPDGTFSAQVALKSGKNDVEVVAEGILGGEKRSKGSVTADTRGPPLEADPSKLYDRPKPR